MCGMKGYDVMAGPPIMKTTPAIPPMTRMTPGIGLNLLGKR